MVRLDCSVCHGVYKHPEFYTTEKTTSYKWGGKGHFGELRPSAKTASRTSKFQPPSAAKCGENSTS
jgi:hypothetical protein